MNDIKKSYMFKSAVEIIKILQNNGHDAVIAGGAVRDMIIGNEPKDLDIATSAMPEEVENLFPRTIPVGKQFGVIIVLHNEMEFETATFRTDSNDSDGRRPNSIEFSSMKEDAKRRDLTMNSLFFDPIENKIFDFVGGEKDIKKKIVRFVGNPNMRIMEDKLRMMRAIRFTSRMGFRLDEESWKSIKRHSAFIEDVSSERIHQEMDKILIANKPSIGIEMLKACGLLEVILPEVNLLWSCEQSPKWHMEGNAAVHSLMTLDAIRKETSDVKLLWAALLHDIGKPTAFKIEDGRITAHGHDKLGEDIARDILNRLRFSKNDIDDIVWLVGNHMRIKHAKEMKKSKLRRLVADERLNDLILVSKCDSESAIRSNEVSRIDEHIGWIEAVEKFVEKLKDHIELPRPLVSGKDLIDLGFKPGPKFKEILNHISELQLGDEIKTKEEAIVIIKSLT